MERRFERFKIIKKAKNEKNEWGRTKLAKESCDQLIKICGPGRLLL